MAHSGGATQTIVDDRPNRLGKRPAHARPLGRPRLQIVRGPLLTLATLIGLDQLARHRDAG